VTIEIIWPQSVPRSEFDAEFVQGMANRMATSFFRYGKLVEAYPHKINALDSLELRLKKYRETGNTEYLIDAANFAMIEFKLPSLPNARFEATDSNGSPGRINREGHITQESNKLQCGRAASQEGTE
jgi:hypothetical protein